MNRFNCAKNKAAVFFAMAILPATFISAQSNDTVIKEKQIEEVVVIGYGKQRKESVTGSVASISGAVLKEIPAGNVTEALQGRLPGVELGRTSSKPGAAMQIRIRGTRSLTASNDPLIVLDGIPFAGSIGDISPSDIKSLDILKDASATAIYGSRGANGVILISTHRGVKGQKARLTYNSFTGVQTLFSKYPLMDGAKFLKLRQDAGRYYNGTDEADDVNTDWQDMYYRSGLITNHDVGLTGGTEGGNYSTGLTYFKQEGVVPLQYYERFSARASIDQQIGSHFRMGLSTTNNFTISNANGMNTSNILQYSPLANPYNEDGTLKRIIKSAADDIWIYTKDGINALGDKYVDQTRAFASYNNIYGELDIPFVTGLKYRLNVGLNYRNSNSGSYTGQGVFNVNPNTISSASIGNSLTTQWVIENVLTYDRTFGKHKINGTALYSAEQTKFNSSYIQAKDIPSDAFQFYNLGHAQGEIIIDPANQNYFKTGLVSWMGRAMYTYDNKYMITATVRSDAASVLAPGNQWHTYPALSVGWNMTNESFLQDSNFINLLKLRAGYGETSNQAVSAYSTLGRLSAVPYNFGDAGDSSYYIGNYVTQLPNPNLGWEYSETYNYGVDFSLFNKRLTGSAEYYVTNTKDILLSKGLPPTNGVGSYMANIGKTQNKGFEISLNGIIIDNPEGFSWEAGINLYSNKNKLVALNSGETRDEGNMWFVGHNINAIYDYKSLVSDKNNFKVGFPY